MMSGSSSPNRVCQPLRISPSISGKTFLISSTSWRSPRLPLSRENLAKLPSPQPSDPIQYFTNVNFIAVRSTISPVSRSGNLVTENDGSSTNTKP